MMTVRSDSAAASQSLSLRIGGTRRTPEPRGGSRGEVCEMLKLYVKARTWMDRDEGATAVEYGIMVAAIAAVIVAVVFLIGEEILVAFETVLDELQ